MIDDLLRNGVSRVVIGSAAVERPDEVDEWLARFGPERICLAFDIRIDRGRCAARAHARLDRRHGREPVGRDQRAFPLAWSSTFCAPTSSVTAR